MTKSSPACQYRLWQNFETCVTIQTPDLWSSRAPTGIQCKFFNSQLFNWFTLILTCRFEIKHKTYLCDYDSLVILGSFCVLWWWPIECSICLATLGKCGLQLQWHWATGWFCGLFIIWYYSSALNNYCLMSFKIQINLHNNLFYFLFFRNFCQNCEC